MLPLIGGKPFERASNTICPSNIAKEKILQGINIEPSVAATRFSPSFDAMYCDFPHEPWTVDRFANLYGNDDASVLCNTFNTELVLGQRTYLEEKCFVSLSEPRVQQCLKLYYSLQCTVGCPAYGQPARFTSLCSDVCDTLEQACGFHLFINVPNAPTFLMCLNDAARIVGFGIPYSCSAPGDLDCSRPDLTPMSGKFERDYCFYGDPARCSGSDCKVSKSDTWGIYDLCGAKRDTSDQAAEVSTQSSDLHDSLEKAMRPLMGNLPIELRPQVEATLAKLKNELPEMAAKRSVEAAAVPWCLDVLGNQVTGPLASFVVYPFKIDALPTQNGRPCDRVITFDFFGGRVDGVRALGGSSQCAYDYGVCYGVGVYQIEALGGFGLPTLCDSFAESWSDNPLTITRPRCVL